MPSARIRFLLLVALLFVLAGCLPSAAQFQGVPPMQFQGVPPSGLGGNNNGGGINNAPGFRSNGFGAATSPLGCCASFFFPSGFSPMVPMTSLSSEHHHRHHRDGLVGAIAEPVYVPYAVPYADDSDSYADSPDEADDAQYPEPAQPPRTVRSSATAKRKAGSGASLGNNATTAGSAPDDISLEAETANPRTATPATADDAALEAPVSIQPATVLIFKDGHRSKIVNYAIVGDTLFDFADGRARKILLADIDLPATQKANDALGVEFKLPPTPGAPDAAN
jgi:hypothetical protein